MAFTIIANAPRIASGIAALPRSARRKGPPASFPSPPPPPTRDPPRSLLDSLRPRVPRTILRRESAALSPFALLFSRARIAPSSKGQPSESSRLTFAERTLRLRRNPGDREVKKCQRSCERAISRPRSRVTKRAGSPPPPLYFRARMPATMSSTFNRNPANFRAEALPLFRYSRS